MERLELAHADGLVGIRTSPDGKYCHYKDAKQLQDEIERLTDLLKKSEEEMLFWRREFRLLNAAETKAEEEIKRLEQANTIANNTISLMAKSNAALKAEIAELKANTWCAYCGKAYPLDTVNAEQISEHIRTCPNHPMRAVERHMEALEEQNNQVKAESAALKDEIEKLRIKEAMEAEHEPKRFKDNG